jgi:Protein of unknown function (DUF1569)
MAILNIFSKDVADGVIVRIQKLSASTVPQWGKMNAGQMLAHCNVTYEMAYENKHPAPGGLMKFFLKMVVKPTVCGATPYKRNLRTAPAFLMTTEKDFEAEKARLIGYINHTQQLGESHFEGKESLSFGKLTSQEWNTMFYKHLDHHLTQFGV